jgi:hypothetical protein
MTPRGLLISDARSLNAIQRGCTDTSLPRNLRVTPPVPHIRDAQLVRETGGVVYALAASGVTPSGFGLCPGPGATALCVPAYVSYVTTGSTCVRVAG